MKAVAALEIHDLHKYFGPNHALRGISLKVNERDIFGFLGPNGAGKSTTIRCIMDYIRPTAGRISVLGHDAHAASTELKRTIGYVPAEPNLYPGWTVGEHIDFVASMRSVDPRRSDTLRQKLDISLKPRVHELSTGNQQKLAIVLALMASPKLLILDEPTRGLDPLLQSVFHELLREYRDGGGTVFLSSHNLAEVDDLCNQVAIIKEGELVTSASIEALKQKNLHSISVTFAGKVPDLSELEVENFVVAGHKATFQIRGDINRALHELSKHAVRDIEITRATLEQMFMEMYR